MKYIDIHTHALPRGNDGSTVFLNWIIGQEKPKHMLLSAGIHPWFIEDEGKKQFDELREVAYLPEIRMIGEAGLDKLAVTPFDIQLQLFRGQILLAEELCKPLIIHCVKAWQELIALHKEYRPLQPWIIHGFRGKGRLAEQLVQEGFYLSFGERFQIEALQAAWPTRLLVETDESRLLLPEIYQTIAHSLHLSQEVFGVQIEQNLKIFLSEK